MPIQPSSAGGIMGTIELDTSMIKGLNDLEGFSHIILIYHFHLIKTHNLSVVPFMDDKPHGIFATRSPARPNPIGMSIVELKKIESNLLFIEGVDMINETPLLDIKPFFSQFDNRLNAKTGWLNEKEQKVISQIKSDNRFNQ